jgi:hypothetical protein
LTFHSNPPPRNNIQFTPSKSLQDEEDEDEHVYFYDIGFSPARRIKKKEKADNLLMKIKLSYPIKEVVNINGGFRDFNLASDGSIIADYGKPHKNDIYRLYARGKKFKKFIDVSPPI